MNAGDCIFAGSFLTVLDGRKQVVSQEGSRIFRVKQATTNMLGVRFAPLELRLDELMRSTVYAYALWIP